MTSSATVDPENHPITQTDRGHALRLAWGLMDIPWHDGFDQSAFTVEIVAMPRVVREWLVTGVFPDIAAVDASPRTSRGLASAATISEQPSRPEAGWGLMIGHQGELAAMIILRSGKTRILWNHSRILDNKWHHLAMTYDGTDLKLYVDGSISKQEELLTDAVYLGHGPGLRVGAHTAVVCEGLMQELRLSRGVRDICCGNEPMQPDPQTIGLWRVDQRRCDGDVPDVLGRCPAGVVKAFAPESLDETEKREFQAGPAPFDLPSRQVELHVGEAEHADAAPVLLLDGQWEMAEGDGDAARWEQAIAAQIPGSVHTALQAAGKIPDPTFAMNDAIAREQSFKTWWFRKTFPPPSGDRHRLIFDGIAIHCTVWLNGEKLGEHEGMFGGPSFDVSTLLRDTNELIVKLDPAPTGPPWFAPTANTGWKKTVVFNNVYGWHYCHIPALGIWRSVRIESMPAVKLCDPFVVTHDAHQGEISIRVDLQCDQPISDGELIGTISPENFPGESHRFEFSLAHVLMGEGRGEGSSVATNQNGPHPNPLPAYRARGQSVHLRVRIPNPKLWWPSGLGEQNLYRLTLSLRLKDGAQSDRVSTTFGLRTIQMSPLPGGARPTLYNWTFIVNGRPTFMKGTGWCTMDAAMDFSPQRYERFLQLAKEQNCTMLRCWGSGMPETDEFFDQCDRLGIVVMQEWPTAWNSHEDQPLDALEETVRLNTLRLRNHPSLLMWGGGNESSKPFGTAIDMMGRLATELDGTRPFHRGEPWGGSDHNYGCWWGNLPLDHNLKLTGRFFGEFGIASMPNYESVQRYLPDDQKNLWPPPADGVLAHHTPVFNTMQDMDRLQQYAGYFSACGTMQRFIVASQIAQAVAVRHTLERARSRWPHCTGALMYKLNDNFPGASWSTADWYGAVKLSHWFVQDAFAPLHGCLLFESVNHRGRAMSLPVFLLDDVDALAGSAWKVEVRAYNSQLRLIQAEEYSGHGSIHRVSQLGDFVLTDRQTESTPLLFVIDVRRDGELVDRTFYFVNYEDRKDCLFDLPATTLSLQVIGNDALLTNTGTLPAVGAMVQRPRHLDTFSASDNCIWLEPGESRQIHVSHTDGLSVDAWNLNTLNTRGVGASPTR